MLWHIEHARVCVPTYMRNTYPGVGSVLRAIIACRPEDSLRPVLSYPSSSLATAPRQTHDHNPSFPFRLPDLRSLVLARANQQLPPLSRLSLFLSEESTLVGFFSSSGFLRSLVRATCLFSLAFRGIGVAYDLDKASLTTGSLNSFATIRTLVKRELDYYIISTLLSS